MNELVNIASPVKRQIINLTTIITINKISVSFIILKFFFSYKLLEIIIKNSCQKASTQDHDIHPKQYYLLDTFYCCLHRR